MIDPVKITQFDLPKERLEEYLLFWICAAGKNAKSSAKGLETFLSFMRKWFRYQGQAPPRSPLLMIRKKEEWHRQQKRPGRNGQWIAALMKISGIGCYNIKSKSFLELAYSGLDLKTCTIEDLEKIHGIGMKTSRCFLIHSRRDADCAGLDTHILHYMRDLGYDVPRSTPSSRKQYLLLEREFVRLAKKARMSIAEFDLKIWRKYSGN